MTEPLTMWQKLKILLMINGLYDTIQRRLTMPDKNKVPWWKQKTTWAAGLAAIGVIGSFITGEMALMPAITAFVAAIAAIFMRQGIEKSKP